jgi:hypothetical protein
VADAREKLEHWRWDYNRIRPHSALGASAPEQFVNAWQTGQRRPRLSTVYETISVDLLEVSHSQEN